MEQSRGDARRISAWGAWNCCVVIFRKVKGGNIKGWTKEIALIPALKITTSSINLWRLLLTSRGSEWEDAELQLCLLLLRWTISLPAPAPALRGVLRALPRHAFIWGLWNPCHGAGCAQGDSTVPGIKALKPCWSYSRRWAAGKKCLSSSGGNLGVVSHLHPHPKMGLGVYHQLYCFISLSLEIKNIWQQHCIPKPLKGSDVSLETTRMKINWLRFILIFIFILRAVRFSKLLSHQRWFNSVCCCYVYFLNKACQLCSAPSSRLRDVDGSIRYCSSCC